MIMQDAATSTNTPQAAVQAANKWRDYANANRQAPSGGLSLNVPGIEGVTGGGTLQIGGGTLGQIPATYSRLGGGMGSGLTAGTNTSLNVLS